MVVIRALLSLLFLQHFQCPRTQLPATVTFKVSLPFVRTHKYISSPTIHRHISQLFIHGIPKVSLLPFHFATFLLLFFFGTIFPARSFPLSGSLAFCVWLVSLSRFVFQHRRSENRPMFRSRFPLRYLVEQTVFDLLAFIPREMRI